MRPAGGRLLLSVLRPSTTTAAAARPACGGGRTGHRPAHRGTRAGHRPMPTPPAARARAPEAGGVSARRLAPPRLPPPAPPGWRRGMGSLFVQMTRIAASRLEWP
eukprot:scaffold2419_cov362-Prasinococcus_capsulatus_cf.AAC.3